jgi:hypothetical protein
MYSKISYHLFSDKRNFKLPNNYFDTTFPPTIIVGAGIAGCTAALEANKRVP